MASAQLCKTCLRHSSLARPSPTIIAARYAPPSRSPRRHTSSPPTPLHLDFLAPAWAQQPRRPGPPAPPSRPPAWRTAAPAPPHVRLLSTTPPRPAAHAIRNPRRDAAGEEMQITITARAAARLAALAAADGNPGLTLRVSVESGGCHGFQYLMSLVSAGDLDEREDTLFEDEAAAGAGAGGGEAGYRAKVAMDEPSLELLKGSKIDYTMELIGSQFKVTGIPGAKSSCGCGTSFDIA